jgi:hypothetical protein
MARVGSAPSSQVGWWSTIGALRPVLVGLIAVALLVGAWFGGRVILPPTGAPTASPEATPPTAQGLPPELRQASWVGATGAWGTLAGTLANDYLPLPDEELPLEARDGLVLTQNPAYGTSLLLRTIGGGGLLFAVETPGVALAAQIGDTVVYVAGPRPAAAGQTEPFEREIAGVWRITRDGRVTEVLAPRPVPPQWGDEEVARGLRLSPSGDTLASTVRHGRWRGVATGFSCELEVITTADGVRHLASDTGPVIAATDLVVVVARTMDDAPGDTRVALTAFDVDNGDQLWTQVLDSAGNVFFVADGVDMAVEYRTPGEPPDSRTVALITLASGQMADVMAWRQGAGRFLWGHLSGGRWAVFGPAPQVDSALVDGDGRTVITLLDLTTAVLSEEVWELRLPANET